MREGISVAYGFLPISMVRSSRFSHHVVVDHRNHNESQQRRCADPEEQRDSQPLKDRIKNDDESTHHQRCGCQQDGTGPYGTCFDHGF